MEFIPFKRNHIEQVLSISNSTLGGNYLTAPYLNKYLNSNNYLAFVIIEDNKVVGFISSVILTPPQLRETVLKEKDWFYDHQKNTREFHCKSKLLYTLVISIKGMALS